WGGSSRPGRRRLGAARPPSPRAAGSTAARGGAASLADAARSRSWQDLELRPLADATPAQPLFDFAAVPRPEESDVAFGWGAVPAAGGAPLGAVLVERAGRAVLLHGPLVVIDGRGHDPLEIAAELL